MALPLIIAGVLAVWAFAGVMTIALCMAAARGDRDQGSDMERSAIRSTHGRRRRATPSRGSRLRPIH